MAAAFNLTAQLNLQGPTNVGAIVTNIKKQLNNISANVNVKVSPGTSQNIAALNAAFTSFNATLATTATNSNNAANAIRGLTQAIGQANNPLNNLQQNMNNNATAAAQLTQNLQNLNRTQRVCANDMEELGRQAAGTIRRFAAFGVVTGVMYKVGNSINSASKEFLEFNRELVRVAQVTDTSLSNLTSLTKQISSLSTGFGVASSDLIKVSSTLAQAGLSAKDTEKALKALALSALAPSFDSLNDTVEGSIALMRQFGISADQLEGALGSVNAVAAKFAVEASDIITAIQRTGGVFATASKGVATGTEALNQFISVFTSIRATTRESAETIATGLRTIFTRIQRGPTIDALKEYGVILTDLEGKFVGPYEATKRLSEGLSRLDPRDLRFGQIVEELGGFRQIGKVIPLIQQFAVAQQALKVAQQGQASLAYDAATAQESVANKMTKVREEFVALIRSIGESTSFQTFVKLSLDLTSQLIRLADAAKNVLPALAAIAVARGAGNAISFGRGFVGGLRRNQGGPIGFASGGFVPGQGNSDTVPAMLTPGEFVIRKKAVQTIGADRLAGMNRYAGGGRIITGATKDIKSTSKRKGDFGPKVYQPGKGTLQFDVNPGEIGAFVLSPPKGIEGGYTATQPLEFTLPPNSTYARIAAKQAGLDPKDVSGGVNAKLNPATYPVFFPGLTEGRSNLEKNAQYASAVHKGFLDGISAGVDSTINSVTSKKLLDLPPVYDTNENAIKNITGKLQADNQIRSTMEGYLFESMISAFTGASAAGGRSNFDFPKSAISQNKTQLATLFGNGNQINKLVKAEAKRSYGEVGGNIQRKVANDISKGYKSGVSIRSTGKREKFAEGGSPEDTVPALLTPGEFVINRKAASRIGLPTLHKMNRADKVQGFNKGGFVQGFAGGGLIGAGLKLGSFALRRGMAGLQRWRGATGTGLSGGAANAAGGGGGMFDLMGLLGGQAALSYFAGENPESTETGRGIQDIGGAALTSSAVGGEAGRMLGGNRGALLGRLAGATYGAYTGYGQTSKTKQAYDERIQQEIIDMRGEESSKGIQSYITSGKDADKQSAMLRFKRLQEEEAKGGAQLTRKEGESTESFTKRLQKTQEQGASQAKDLLFAEMKKTGKTFSEVSKSMNPQELDMLTQNIAETDSEYIQLQQQRNKDVAGLRASGANKAADELQKTYNTRLSALAGTIVRRESAELDAATNADRLAKEAKKLHDAMRKATMSIETTFNAIGQALEKTAFNMDQASARGEEIMSGKISGANPFERNVNILKNPSAYSEAERQAAGSANGLLGNQSKLVNDIARLSESKSRAIGVGIVSEKKEGATKESVAEDVVRQLTKDIEATFGPNSTASQVYIAAIEKQREAALKAAEGQTEFDVESFVESVAGPLNSASKQAGELQIQSQQLLAKAFKDLSKVGEELSSIQQKQIERGQQLISMQYANNAAMKESLGIRSTLAGRTSERSQLAANRLGFKDSNITSKDILNRYTGLQQGRSAAEADKLRLGNALGPDQKISQQFLSASNTLANFNAEIKNLEQEISNLPKVLQDNLEDVFNEMKKRTALLESSKQAGGDFAARLVTSTPQELRELSSTFNVMNNAINGNVTSIQQSQSAQKAYYTALMSGKNAQEAMTDAQQAFASQNRDALSLFKDLADVAGVEGADIDMMKANMLESFAKAQGMENFQPLQMMIAKLRETPAQRAQNDPILQALQGQANTLMQAQVEAVNLANEIDRQQQARLLTEVGDKIIAELRAAPIQIQVAVQNMSAMTGGLQAPQTKKKGGIVYASKGAYVNYQPKGTDTVPAMLTPGEFVVNAESTKNNLGLLQSINKANGGSVSRVGKFQTVSGSKADIDLRGRMSNSSNAGRVAYLAKGGFGIDWDTFAPGVNDPAKPKAKPNQFTVNPNATGAEDLITNRNQAASKASKKSGWGNWFQSIKDNYKVKSKEAKPFLDAMKKQDREVGAKIGKGVLKLGRSGLGAVAGFAIDPVARAAVGAAGGGEEAQNITGNVLQGGFTYAGGVGSVALGAIAEAKENLTAEQRQAKYERERTANDTYFGGAAEGFANPLGGLLRLGRAVGQQNEAQTNAAKLESETLAKSRPEYRAKVIAEAQANDRRLDAEARAKQNEAEKARGLSGQDVAALRNIRMSSASPDNRAKPSAQQLEKEAKIKAGWTWDEFDQVWVPPVKSKPAGVKPPPAVLAKQKRGEALAFGRAGATGFSAVTGTIGGGSKPATASSSILPQAGLNKGMTNAPANPQLTSMFFGQQAGNYTNMSPMREAIMRNVPLEQVNKERRERASQRRMAPYLQRQKLAQSRSAYMAEMRRRNQALLPKYRAAGGSIVPYSPKGTDTVPTMLTPGEFVVNRDSTQKNLGLLRAINNQRGGQVNYLANGGMAGGSSTGVLSGIDSLVGGFNQFVQQLKEALPTAVNVQGRHDVNVVINGASILQNVLEGPLGNMVKTAINEAFSTRSQQNEGSTV